MNFQILCKRVFFLLLVLKLSISKCQIGNYVSNGSFESLNSYSLTSYYNVVNYWQPIDTGKYADYLATTIPPIANVPYAAGFQYPRTGNNYILSTLFCPQCSGNNRGYPRNRLKKTLTPNTTYCLKYYVVNTNNSGLGIDAFGVYFGDSSLDTIKFCNIPLTYLIPQVQNPASNTITDTLNWIAITGTFVANGNEKYMVLGNFKSDLTTNTVVINSSSMTTVGTEVCIDDVSVIEVNLPAYAGPDRSLIPGDSVYIGRESDFAIDPGCIWYKLPNTTTAIDTVSGLWVKPTSTTTYVVKQTLDCSPEKWDTVVVYMNPLGIVSSSGVENDVSLFPNPAKDHVELTIINERTAQRFKTVKIYTTLGQICMEEELLFKAGSAELNVSNLYAGIYLLELKTVANESITKKLIIAK